MRTFKFRAWDEDERKYVTPISIDFNGYVYDFNSEKQNYEIEQFTGLIDKNGKEIYEGDIIQTSVGAKEIGWNNEYSRFGFHHESAGFYAFCKLDNFEVIGNIHENKGLLK